MGEYSNLGYTDVERHKSAHKAFVLDFREFRVDIETAEPSCAVYRRVFQVDN